MPLPYTHLLYKRRGNTQKNFLLFLPSTQISGRACKAQLDYIINDGNNNVKGLYFSLFQKYRLVANK
jgi:hypothetical protein